jgi:hypothetical protein
MTSLSGLLTIYPKDRLFEPIEKIALVIDALGTAFTVMQTGRVLAKLGDYAGVEAKLFCMEVRIPLTVPLLAVVKNLNVDYIQIGFDPRNNLSTPLGKVEGFNKILLGLITPVYVDFIEKHRSWIRSAYGGDANAWPNLLNFARLVRNFISHHGGRVHFDNSNAPSVAWHSLTYGPADEGKLAVGGDLFLGDMIILLVEVSHELDRLGCPL